MKKILIITHSFPPGAGSGVIRTLKFAKYLPENGWQPMVLTLHERFNEKKDYSMVGEIPEGTLVRRTGMLDPFELYRGMKSVASKAQGGSCPAGAQKGGAPERAARSMRGSLKDFLSTPDRFVGWTIPATLAGLAMIRSMRPHLIYSTSPVETPHLIGLLLKKITRVPWIIDLRDPWMLRYQTQPRSRLLEKCEGRLERAVMASADAVIANNDFLKEQYLVKYGSLIGHKLQVIVNGFDAADFEGIGCAPQAASARFTVSHVGEFYHRMRTPDGFLTAVAHLISQGSIPAGSIRVRFVGAGEYVQTAHFASLIRDLRLDGVVETLSHQEHGVSIRQMFESDALLLLQPDPMNKAQIPAKSFEYLRSGRPILAIAPPDGATAMLLGRFAQASVNSPEDSAGLKQQIMRRYREWQSGLRTASLPQEEINAFDRRELTKKLARIADTVAGSAHPGSTIRVMHLIPSLETGGMENGVVNLVNGLDPAAFTSIVCCLERGGELRARLRDDIQVIELGQKQGIRLFLAWKLARLFRVHRIDIAHTHNFYALAYGALAVKLCRGVRLVHGEHGMAEIRPARRKALTRLFTRSSACVLSVSQALKETLVRDGVDPERIRVIPNGIDPAACAAPPPTQEERSALGIGERDIVIGSVGRLAPVKDYRTLISAFAILRRRAPDALLLIIGDGSQLEELKEHAVAHACGDRVRFLGRRDDVASLYRFMRVFVNSSKSEGMSNAILEAFACRVPVVATRVGDNPLLVHDGRTGLLVDPENPALLAGAIAQLVDDPVRAASMGERGFERVKESFSMDAMIRAYAQTYRDCVPGGKK